MITLNLDNRKQAKKEIMAYLEIECPHYLGGKPISAELVKDSSVEFIEGQKSRVLVYDVRLDNQSEAFGTIGGILYNLQQPSCNLFPKSKVDNANLAAGMHLYLEAKMRFPKFFGKGKNLEKLAIGLEIPNNLR